MNAPLRVYGGFVFILILAACAQIQPTLEPHPTPVVAPTADQPESVELPGNLDTFGEIIDESSYVITQLLPRDGIPPIYDPTFIDAETAEISGDSLVMGLEINGDARAYQVGILRSREMVNDVVGGTPVLVTW